MATVLKYYFPPTDITFGALDPRMTEHGYTIERFECVDFLKMF